VVQSVELLLDDGTDGSVRAQWDLLAGTGLPSQARHAGPTNRPHVTVAVRAWLDPGLEPALRAAVGDLPLPLRLGGLTCFGRNRFVLVRLVVPEVGLLALHAAVCSALGPDPDDVEARGNLAPGRWTPHVTLARRLMPEQVGAALGVLSGAPGGTSDIDGHAVGCRRWDGEARRETSLVNSM